MRCESHPDVQATARCTRCGRYLCGSCARRVDGKTCCANCLAASPATGESILVPAEDLHISRAFTFMFDDPRWWIKTIVGALFVLASVLVVPLFFLLGYQVAVIRAVASGRDTELPEWDDLAGKFKDGASLFLTGLVYAAPMLVIMGIVLTLGILVGRTSPGGTGNGFLVALAFIFFTAGWLLAIAYGFLLRLASPAFAGVFARTGSVRQALQPGVLIGLIRADLKAYLLVWLITTLVTSTIAFMGVFACCIGILATVFYATVVNAHLIGQLTRLNPLGMKVRDGQ